MADERISVEVAYALPEQQCIRVVQVAPGTTARQAAELSGIASVFPQLDLAAAPMGIFSQAIDPDRYVLKAGDRVEIYRPLICDPKAARQARADKVREKKWRTSL